MAKDRKDDKKGAKKDAKPRKRGGILLLALVLLVSAAVTALLIRPTARERAIGLIKDPKAALASILLGDREPQEPGMLGGDAALKVQNNLAAKFAELEARESDYSIQHFPKDNVIDIKAAVPRGRPMEWVIWDLTSSAVRSTPYRVDDCACAQEANCTVTFASANAKHPKIILSLRQSGRYMSNTAKMAILIEDFGFEANETTAAYLSFPEPLTVSLVPAQKLSAWTAQIADEYKKEVVLLLPMEPLPAHLDKYKAEMITIIHSEEKIRSMLAQAAAAIPNFSGVANFHGAKVMEDSRVMEIILSETNKRKAYFVYSDVSRKSVAPQLVKTMKTPNCQIQGTVDATHSAEQARERLRRYAVTAEKTGKILVKAQPSPAFIQVLKEESEALKRNGIRLVYVSELMK